MPMLGAVGGAPALEWEEYPWLYAWDGQENTYEDAGGTNPTELNDGIDIWDQASWSPDSSAYLEEDSIGKAIHSSFASERTVEFRYFNEMLGQGTFNVSGAHSFVVVAYGSTSSGDDLVLEVGGGQSNLVVGRSGATMGVASGSTPSVSVTGSNKLRMTVGVAPAAGNAALYQYTPDGSDSDSPTSTPDLTVSQFRIAIPGSGSGDFQHLLCWGVINGALSPTQVAQLWNAAQERWAAGP